MTHTPGPWKAVGASVYSETPQEVDHGRYRGFNEREPHGFLIAESIPHKATARLIAAAPDLLAALEEMAGFDVDAELSECDASDLLFRWVSDARAAIAKAKGEAA